MQSSDLTYLWVPNSLHQATSLDVFITFPFYIFFFIHPFLSLFDTYKDEAFQKLFLQETTNQHNILILKNAIVGDHNF